MANTTKNCSININLKDNKIIENSYMHKIGIHKLIT